MAKRYTAPKGNEFWKLRTKHGRDKIFKTPSELWLEARKYFQWCEANPWKKIDFKGKDADKVIIETPRPFTLTGLAVFLDVSSEYIQQFERERRKEDTEEARDFLRVLTRIREIIYTQKLEGAMVGTFNASVVSMEIGLKNKAEVELKTSDSGIDYSKLSKEALEEIAAQYDEQEDENGDQEEDVT